MDRDNDDGDNDDDEDVGAGGDTGGGESKYDLENHSSWCSFCDCLFNQSNFTADVQYLNIKLLLKEIKDANRQLLTKMYEKEGNITPMRSKLDKRVEQFTQLVEHKMIYSDINSFRESLNVSELKRYNDIMRLESELDSVELTLATYKEVSAKLAIHICNLNRAKHDVKEFRTLSNQEYKALFRFVNDLDIRDLIKKTQDGLISMKTIMNKKPMFSKDLEYLDATKKVFAGKSYKACNTNNKFLKPVGYEVKPQILKQKARLAVES